MSRIHDALVRAEKGRLEGNEGLSSYVRALGESAVESPVTLAAPTVIDESDKKAVEIQESRATTEFADALERCAHHDWNPDPARLILINPNEAMQAAGEQYRVLRSRLMQFRRRKTLKTILIASAMPSDGKSFTAANLAHMLTKQPNNRVLLIDADLRCSRLHTFLGTTSHSGVSEFLEGKADEIAIIQKGSIPNLLFSPTGRPTV